MPTPPLIEHFAVLKDPRIDRTKQHLLLDIVVIAFCAVLCGAEGWEDMETFGHAKKEWLQERLGLELPHGVPGDDTFRRLFARLDPEEFGRCFLSFAQSLHTHTQGEVIALDGKTLRHSFDVATGQAAIHLVSAWATGSAEGSGDAAAGVAEGGLRPSGIPFEVEQTDLSVNGRDGRQFQQEE